MVDGFDDDDQWRMVEDEFCAVAGHFTAHLHAAQYRRLKEEAKKQDPNTIPNISRPVIAPPTSHVKRRQTALALAAAQRKGVKAALSRINDEETEDEDEEIPWKDTHLAGLMNSPRKKVQPLPRMTSIVGGSRAAALGIHRNGITNSSISKVTFPNHRDNSFPASTASGQCLSSHVGRRCVPQSRTTSQRVPVLSESDDDDDLERYSSRQPSAHPGLPRAQPGTAKIEVSQSNHTRSASSTTGIGSRSRETYTAKPLQVSRSSSAAVASPPNQPDSDSGQETYFQRRMRERRGKRKSSRYTSPTPDEPSEKEESQPSQQKSQNSPNTVLIVPSF